MHLMIGTSQIHADVQNESTFVSRHTGGTLRRREVAFRLSTEVELDQVQGIVSWGGDDRQIVETDEAGQVVATWKVTRSSSIHEGGPPYAFRLELEEMEELHPDALVLDDLELRPYAYEEWFRDEALAIRARVRLSASEHNRLTAFREEHQEDYFTVQRTGLSATTLTMRFGQCVWSGHEDLFKHEVVLVEKKYDEAEKAQGRRVHGTNEPELSNLAAVVLTRAARLDALLEKLKEKGVLDEEEIQDLRTTTVKPTWESQHALLKVDDLDEW